MTWNTLGKLLSQLPNQASWQQRCRLLHIHNYWRDWVGVSVAQQSEPEAVVKGVLYVNVSSPIWANALTFERLRLLEKINQHLGQAHLLPIDDIRFSTAKWNSQRRQKAATKPDLADHPSWYRIHKQVHSNHDSDHNPLIKPRINSRISLIHLQNPLQTHSGNAPKSQVNQKVTLTNLRSTPKPVVVSPTISNKLPDHGSDLAAAPPIKPPNKPPENALEALERWRKLVKQQESALVKCPQCQRHCPQGEVQRWQMCRVCATYKLFR
ncbi:MAG: DciA family protein [Pseudanabaenaceae cyanobacterium]